METSSAEQAANTNRFVYQFLQVETHLDYPDGTILKQEGWQDDISQRMFDSAKLQARRGSLPRRYEVKTLKELVERIEASIKDDEWDDYAVSDDLCDSLSHMMSLPTRSAAEEAQDKTRVTYHLSLLPIWLQTVHDPEATMEKRRQDIDLLEYRSLLAAGGTTGLRTWEAALHLGQYLCVNPGLIKNKNVLELGAGTGYLSVLCASYLEAEHVTATDGSQEVIDILAENFAVNGLGAGSVTQKQLRWGEDLLNPKDTDEVDVILGADVTYDASVIPSLIQTLKDIVLHNSHATILIAATERNKATYDKFQSSCQDGGFNVDTVEFPNEEVWLQQQLRQQIGEASVEILAPFYSRAVPIHICQLTN